ncbi:BrnT family toxin [uncultured Desulfosarcina sp.]
MGQNAFERLLVVVYTWREDTIRIISARKAVRSEVR